MKSTIELVAAIVSIVIPVATAAYAAYKYFKEKKKNKKLEQVVRHIASTGVALGYYYNFVSEVFAKLKAAKLKIEIYKDDAEKMEEVREFDTHDVKLQIIMPDNLRVGSMDDALEKMRIHRKGDIISKGSDRNFGINFRFDGKNKIIILDFPKPLNAIREHMLRDPRFINTLDNSGKLGGMDVYDSAEWKAIEKEEMENFKLTIYNLMERAGIGLGRNKIEFVGIHDVPEEKARPAG